MTPNETWVRETVEKLTREGLVAIPVHRVGPDGVTCSCPDGGRCTKGGKHAIGDGWDKQKGGIEAFLPFFEKNRSVNVGVLPEPSNVVVIDIDPRNNGDLTMKAFVDKHGPMPKTKIVKTGSGGYHYYFKAKPGLKLMGHLGGSDSGVDIKYNGFVVAEGSTSHAGSYSALIDAPLAELPEAIIEEAQRPTPLASPTPSAPKPKADPSDPDLPRQRRYLSSAWEREKARLTAMREAAVEDWGRSSQSYTGEHWDNTVHAVACNAIEIGNHPAMGASVEDLLEEVREEAPRDDDFTDDDVDRIIKSARDRVGDTHRDVPPPSTNPFGDALTAEPAAVRALDRMQGRSWKDSHVAQAFAEHYVDTLRFVPNVGWLRWNPMEGVWREIDKELVMGMSDDFARELVEEAARTGDKDTIKHALSRLDGSKIKTVASLAAGIVALREPVSALDGDSELLNCANGYVDLRTKDLYTHNPDKMMTKSTGVAYNPNATHPDVDELLSCLDKEERDWIQLVFGQALTGEIPKEDFLLILHGVGANGKTALLGAFKDVVGDYGIMLSDRTIIANDNAHNTEMTDLLGARVAILEELPESGRLSTKRIKSIVGTKEITARKMHRDSITWRASHTVFITTNHRPRFTETDHGIWRRLAMLTFPYRFVPTEAAIQSENDRVGDMGLRHRMTLAPQKEALLAWAVDGAAKYLARGEDEPLEITERMQQGKSEWRHGVDPTGRFIEEMIEFDPGSWIPGTDLYDEFKNWLSQNGHTPWSAQLVSERLEMHHEFIAHDVRKARVTVREGVNISYRPPVSVTYADGQKMRGWKGVRWKVETEVPSRGDGEWKVGA